MKTKIDIVDYSKIYTDGLESLKNTVVGTIRFLEMFDNGVVGDYTTESTESNLDEEDI